MKIARKVDEILIIDKTIDDRPHKFNFNKEDFNDVITNDDKSTIKKGGFGTIHLLKKHSLPDSVGHLDGGERVYHKFVVKSTDYSAEKSFNSLEVVIMRQLAIRNPELSAYLGHVYFDKHQNYSSGIYNGQLLTIMDYMQYDLQEIMLFFDNSQDKRKDSKNRFRKDFDGQVESIIDTARFRFPASFLALQKPLIHTSLLELTIYSVFKERPFFGLFWLFSTAAAF